MILFLAWRQIRWRKKQTLISVLSIAVGVCMAIVMGSTRTGFEKDFTERLVSVSPHVQLTAERSRPKPVFDEARHRLAQVVHIKSFDIRQTINGSNYWSRQIQELAGVQAISHVYNDQGLIRFSNKDQAVVVRGIEPQQEAKISGFSSNLLFKRDKELTTTKNAIILGSVPVAGRPEKYGQIYFWMRRRQLWHLMSTSQQTHCYLWRLLFAISTCM